MFPVPGRALWILMTFGVGILLTYIFFGWLTALILTAVIAFVWWMWLS